MMSTGGCSLREFLYKAISVAMSAALAALPAIVDAQNASAFQATKPSEGFVIGVVVLSELPAGQETSGSVVTNPEKYQEIPGLVVVLAEVPKPPQPAKDAPAAAMLTGVVVDTGDGRKQPADRPLTWVPQLGRGFETLRVLLSDKPDQPIATANLPIDQTPPPVSDGPGSAATPSNPVQPGTTPTQPGSSTTTETTRPTTPTGTSRPTTPTETTRPTAPSETTRPAMPSETTQPPVSRPPTDGPSTTASSTPPGSTTPVSSSCTMSPVSTAGAVQVIHGDTGGNVNDMKVTVDDGAANIVAAKPGTVFWDVPQDLKPGSHRVVFSPGGRRPRVVLMLFLLELQMSADQINLIRGQSTRMHVVVTGLEDLPASVWQQAEAPPHDLMDLKRMEKLAPGVHMPTANEPGTVILILQNQSPETIRMGSRGSVIVLQLHQRDFAKGPYRYDDKIQSIKSGGFGIRGVVTSFLKQVTSESAGPGLE